MKIYFVTNMYEKMPFASDFIFYETNFENSKKLESIVNIFIFIKISCQSKESPLSKKILPFSPTPSYLEKIFLPNPYCQIRESQSSSPFVKGGEVGGLNYAYV